MVYNWPESWIYIIFLYGRGVVIAVVRPMYLGWRAVEVAGRSLHM